FFLSLALLTAYHLSFIALCGCAGLEPAIEESLSRGKADLSGFQTYESLHFTVKTKNYDHSRQVTEICEQIYNKIMFDTNLLSFKPRENYPIVIFTDKQEY